MYWLIALLVIGLLAYVGYRYWQNPPLSRVAKQQRENYIRSLQWEKTFIYRMEPDQLSKLENSLKVKQFHAGDGCFYGQNAIIHLKSQGSQVTLRLFCPTEDDLTRHAWKIARMVNQLGGPSSAAAHG